MTIPVQPFRLTRLPLFRHFSDPFRRDRTPHRAPKLTIPPRPAPLSLPYLKTAPSHRDAYSRPSGHSSSAKSLIQLYPRITNAPANSNLLHPSSISQFLGNRTILLHPRRSSNSASNISASPSPSSPKNGPKSANPSSAIKSLYDPRSWNSISRSAPPMRPLFSHRPPNPIYRRLF
jgi:hypothetical protein